MGHRHVIERVRNVKAQKFQLFAILAMLMQEEGIVDDIGESRKDNPLTLSHSFINS